MRTYAGILAATALLVSTGMASAQSRNYDSSGAPKSSSSSPRSGGGLVDNSTTGSSGANGMSGVASNPDAHPGDAGAAQAAPPPGPDNGGTLNPRAPSNAR
jgi:hypothetical protein